MKVGRNDPCPCGSGIKYKKCHLNREHQPRPTEGEIRGQVSKHKIPKTCHFSGVAGAVCEGAIVEAHTVSKSGSLKKIARNGKVYHFKPDINALFDTEGSLILREVGVNVASTFPGFCAKHDRELFAPFEDRDFAITAKNCALLGYRALAKEVHAKETSKAFVPTMRSADKGSPPIMQAYTQSFLNAYSTGIDYGLNDLYRIKAKYDQAVIDSDYSDSKFLAISFSEVPHILFSGALYPEFDFAGNRLQELAKANSLDGIAVNAVATPSGGAVIFQWMGTSYVNERMIKSLLEIPTSDLASVITQFAFESFENLFIAPEWWDSLDAKKRTSLQERTLCGTAMKDHTHRCFVPDGERYATWVSPSIECNITI